VDEGRTIIANLNFGRGFGTTHSYFRVQTSQLNHWGIAPIQSQQQPVGGFSVLRSGPIVRSHVQI
jgi:hypothetical protein